MCRLHLCFRLEGLEGTCVSAPWTASRVPYFRPGRDNSVPSGTEKNPWLRDAGISQGHTKSQGFCPTSLTVGSRWGSVMVKVPFCCFCLPGHHVHFSLGSLSSQSQSSGLNGAGLYSLMPSVSTGQDLSN